MCHTPSPSNWVVVAGRLGICDHALRAKGVLGQPGLKGKKS